MTDKIDYETDPRPLAECLKEFAIALNGGREYGARGVAADTLRINRRTLDGIMDGRPTSYEAMIRRLMTLIASATEKP